MKLTITDTQYKQLPERLQKLFTKMYNPSSEEVRECFPESNGRFGAVNTGNVKFSPADYGKGQKDTGGIKDSGNASRFFKSILYYPKASKSERNRVCEGLEEKEYTMSSTPKRQFVDGVQQEVDFVTKPLSNKNNHPTVKPIALMEYLIKMVTKEGYTVLDPFMGSGTTALACKNINRKFIGFELEKEYVEIANTRIKEEQVGLFTM